ncbi:riboflavin synthase [Candidatus Palibaumannia cicadellinicola]|uniref:Riboflavin synthase n=1 Tax=Candidatus Palibaumannia cicadellinicola TaxID=186490 RepID=A0A088MXA1_9GAMM|nr:riboflavin synthase [Candidatus Baumannia cicadellinicola]AIN46990.1 Riboflavin synthase eubacterial/eukaryotic [Candidatus Baumannia cicadellinicola]
MFTGIVQGIAPIIAITEKDDLRTHQIEFPDHLLPGLTNGASVAHNGCCLTVTHINGNLVSFDLIKETLKQTNLGTLQVGDNINLERAACLNAEISGHLMSGHIIGTAELIKITSSENNRKVWCSLANKKLKKYIFYKNYIGIDGISLTIGEVADHIFCLNLIPETITRTTLGQKLSKAIVNIEIDQQTQATVDTVERFLIAREREETDLRRIR